MWRSELGSATPSRETVCVLCAQFELETEEGTKCVQWNIGNFKYSGTGDFCEFPTTEWINGVETAVVPPDPSCRFAAYSSLEDGVRRWLRDLYTRWGLAWTAACQGDPEGFAQGLHDQKPPYYTGPVEGYRAGMRARFDTLMKALVLPLPSAPPDPLADTHPGIPAVAVVMPGDVPDDPSFPETD
jgi:hypothetical protein